MFYLLHKVALKRNTRYGYGSVNQTQSCYYKEDCLGHRRFLINLFDIRLSL